MSGAEDGTWLAGVFDRAAPTYDRVGAAYHDHFGQRLVDWAGLDLGSRVLDVGCGRGAALLPAARLVGPDGTAVGVDLSPAMVELAGRAAAEEGIRVDVRVVDAHHLDLPTATFDTVLCAFGIFFFPEPQVAMAEMTRMLRPGGWVAVSTWAEDDQRWGWESELLSGIRAQRRAIRQPFTDATDLVALLGKAGLVDIEVRREQFDIVLQDAEQWWAWLWSYSLRGVLEQQDQATLERLHREGAERFHAAEPSGGVPRRLTSNFARARRL